ncbi:MAG: hypothetical protein HY342_05585 [Candidatus Lambdaproteobacteria bacterium]|nr:hypothetical protein [Candidatus Lambdaproteobacteria bacterium]
MAVAHLIKHRPTTDKSSEQKPTPTWIVVVSALLLGIPLALCCTLLLML